MLIPGGKLKIIFNKEDLLIRKMGPILIEDLKIAGFEQFNPKYEYFEEKSIKLHTRIFIKKNINYFDDNHALISKFQDIQNIINKIRDKYYINKDVLIIGDRNNNFEKIDLKAKKTYYLSSLNNSNNNIKEKFEFGIIYNSLEYIYRNEMHLFFQTVKDLFKSNSKIFIIVPHKSVYFSKSYFQLFTKGILTEVLDENLLDFKWMNLDVSSNFILAEVINQRPFPEKLSQEKIAVLGNLEPSTSRRKSLTSYW